MMSELTNTTYGNWLNSIKQQVRQTRIQINLAANAELIRFYWELGKSISGKLQTEEWGNKVIDQLSLDLRMEFPEVKGFSRQNLYYTKQFYEFYTLDTIVQRSVGQLQISDDDIFRNVSKLPWGHNIVIISKSNSLDEALFYVRETIANGWSRDTLSIQIKHHLFANQGNGQTNFQQTLPVPTAHLAQQVIKDPYWFDFVSATSDANERDIENQLVKHISRFLLELGKGFAFLGRQYQLSLGEKNYYLDLLFYHIQLKSYVVVELKNTSFNPTHTGQLSFYLTLVDRVLKTGTDNPTIGILLCREKDKLEVEYALNYIHAPMGVSEFNITEILPEHLQSSLPSVEELENELNNL